MGNSKRARTFGSAVDNSSSTITCFTCHQEGHFSKGGQHLKYNYFHPKSFIDCPSVKSTYNSSSGSTFTPTCYKCGEQGHFSNGMWHASNSQAHLTTLH
jgi:hypothetical protein